MSSGTRFHRRCTWWSCLVGARQQIVIGIMAVYVADHFAVPKTGGSIRTRGSKKVRKPIRRTAKALYLDMLITGASVQPITNLLLGRNGGRPQTCPTNRHRTK